jgi:hypothetical protein
MKIANCSTAAQRLHDFALHPGDVGDMGSTYARGSLHPLSKRQATNDLEENRSPWSRWHALSIGGFRKVLPMLQPDPAVYSRGLSEIVEL